MTQTQRNGKKKYRRTNANFENPSKMIEKKVEIPPCKMGGSIRINVIRTRSFLVEFVAIPSIKNARTKCATNSTEIPTDMIRLTAGMAENLILNMPKTPNISTTIFLEKKQKSRIEEKREERRNNNT